MTLGARWLLASFLIVSCSKKEPPQAAHAVAKGVSVPELSFRTDSAPAEAAPISLTTSDGQGLQLVAVRARTVIEDPLAFTELHLTFRNPEQRRREGRFEIVLPPAAAISRFAMRTASGWQEGEVVERARAQQVYEDFLHRKQDPALLENDAGNEFAARVFPIEAGADKEIILSYSEERPLRSEPYRLPLRGLPRLERFDAEIRLGASSVGTTKNALQDHGTLSVHERDYVPSDLEVRLPSARSFALRNGTRVVARVTPVAKVEEQKIGGLTILFDSSASRALGFGAQIERTAELLTDLSARNSSDFDVRIVAFDQDVEEIYRGPARAFSLRDKGRLLERGAFGASNLEQALSYLAERPDGHERILLVSDGVVTAGQDNTLRLCEGVAKLAAHGVRRLDALVEGAIRDEGALHAITHAGLAHNGVVLDARLSRASLTDKLTRATRDKISVHMPAATWVEPSVIEGAQAGDEFLIFADLPLGVPVQIELDDGTAQQIDTIEASQPLIERAWARAKIAAMTRRERGLEPDPITRQKVRSEIIALSIEHRVLSDYTALLVLETADDYRRFGIAQKALSDVLTVGPDGLTVIDRVVPRLELAQDDLKRKGEQAKPELEAKAAEENEEVVQADSAFEGSAPPSDTLAQQATPAGSAPAPMPAPASAVARDEADTTRARSVRTSSSPAKASSAGAAPKTAGASLEDRASSRGLGGAMVPTPRPERSPPHPALEVAAPSYRAHVTTNNVSSEGLDTAQASGVLRATFSRALQRCYADRAPPTQPERLTLSFSINERGAVADLTIRGALSDATAQACAVAAARALQFPKPQTNVARLEATFSVSRREVEETLIAAATPAQRRSPAPRTNLAEPAIDDAYEGILAKVLSALRQNDVGTALIEAKRAHESDPGDVMALVALGETLEAQQDDARAARVYGSIIDLFPSRADMRRMAGQRLERLSVAGYQLAVDSYERAVEQRPDHPSGHRLLAYALLKQENHEAAFETLRKALGREYPEGRFKGVAQILREDLGLVAAAWLRVDPGGADAIAEGLNDSGARLEKSPSLRFILNWETDANDVDFHIFDGQGGHASYLQPRLPSGGKLYADVTTGYGPECFAIPNKARSYPYTLQAHYFSRGPMGYGMGKLQIVEHDGKGGLKFAEHPFVIMKDRAYVALATVTGPLTE
jgi:tetratricopeptide (TPR) repeat protein